MTTRPNDTLLTIGRRLRTLRTEQGLSLRVVAEHARLSPSFVSMLERGETEIGISRLIRLADAYGVVLGDLLAELDEPEPGRFVPRERARRIQSETGGVEILYPPAPPWSMQPFVVRIEPLSGLDDLQHAGEEFFHCIDGTVTVTIDGTAYILDTSDTVFVPPGARHGYFNHASNPAVLAGAARRPS